MSRTPLIFSALAAWLLACAPAAAFPPLDGGPRAFQLGVGLPALEADVGIGDRVTLGLGATVVAVPITDVGASVFGATRVGLRFTPPDGGPWHLGLLASAGYAGSSGMRSSSQTMWVQPALNMAWAPGKRGFAVRATLGPVVGLTSRREADVMTSGTDIYWLVPNVELAYRFTHHLEVTVGGNGLFGFRARI